jgi:hypothetical protein
MKNEKIVKLKFWTKHDRETIKELEKMLNYNSLIKKKGMNRLIINAIRFGINGIRELQREIETNIQAEKDCQAAESQRKLFKIIA